MKIKWIAMAVIYDAHDKEVGRLAKDIFAETEHSARVLAEKFAKQFCKTRGADYWLVSII